MHIRRFRPAGKNTDGGHLLVEIVPAIRCTAIHNTRVHTIQSQNNGDITGFPGILQRNGTRHCLRIGTLNSYSVRSGM